MKYDFTVTVTYTKTVRTKDEKEAKQLVLSNLPKRPKVEVSMPTRVNKDGSIVTRGRKPIKLKK